MTNVFRITALAVTLAWSTSAVAQELPPIKMRFANGVPPCATPGRLTAFLKSRNPMLDRRYDAVAQAYAHHGAHAGVRWDFAFFQMLVETANLTYRRPNGTPGAVRASQNNFAGIGATGGGASGEHFPDIDTGVVAHLQHIRLYAGDKIARPIAERTRKVQAWGILGRWQQRLGRPATFADLAQHWAPSDAAYGPSISSVARRFYSGACLEPDPAAAIAQKSRPTLATPAATAAAPIPAVEAPSGTSLARAALLRNAQDTPATRAGLGASTLSPDEPPAKPAAALQSVRVLNARMTTPVAPPPLPLPTTTPEPETADEALRTLVNGRTVHLDTPIGATIPITFQTDGTTRGKAGSLASYLGSAHDEGRWWVEKARLCQRWKVWFDRETQCLRFRQAGDLIHWTRDDGRTGTARLAK